MTSHRTSIYLKKQSPTDLLHLAHQSLSGSPVEVFTMESLGDIPASWREKPGAERHRRHLSGDEQHKGRDQRRKGKANTRRKFQEWDTLEE